MNIEEAQTRLLARGERPGSGAAESLAGRVASGDWALLPERTQKMPPTFQENQPRPVPVEEGLKGRLFTARV